MRKSSEQFKFSSGITSIADATGGFLFRGLLMRFAERKRMTNDQELVTRVNARNRNHHLWKNNGTWWCHFTLHYADYTKARIRRSLQTKKVEIARQRRDELLGDSVFNLFSPFSLSRRNE